MYRRVTISVLTPYTLAWRSAGWRRPDAEALMERIWPFLNRRSPLSARLFPRSYDPASALEIGLAVMFLTHLRPNCARSLQFATGVWARAFKIAAEPSLGSDVCKSRAS